MLNEEHTTPKLTLGAEHKREDSNIWYLNNGASNHMTGQRSKFKELNEVVTGDVRFGDGSTVNIQGNGTVTFKCKNVEERICRQVYYILNLCNNILSMGQLSEGGNRVVLNGVFLCVYDEKGTFLMKVKRSENRLYKIILASI